MKSLVKFIKYHRIFSYPFKSGTILYSSIRSDLYELLEEPPKVVLDVGCGDGIGGYWLKKNYNCKVYGIEYDDYHRKLAVEKLDDVFKIDLNKINENDLKQLKKLNPDLVIFADILEHLYDPWALLKAMVNICNKDTKILISLPNIRHYSFILSLVLFGIFPYRNRGINDFTHIRFFTLKNAIDMLNISNIQIVKYKRNLRIIERNNPIIKFSFLLYIPIIRDFFTFQYLFLLKNAYN
jgi:2-polyprenyl-3-methyl-5-hydroxy-6-metoxy-1,4-benzoquinol methylase